MDYIMGGMEMNFVVGIDFTGEIECLMHEHVDNYN